jgi:tetratricopeptide (TPR) repeat protein
MPGLADKKLTQDVVLAQIEQVLRRGQPTDPPAYTLVLGAGASFGSVPTAKEMLGLPAERNLIHPQAIPLYLQSLETGQPVPSALRTEVVRKFWARFSEANSAGAGAPAPLKLHDGLPAADAISTAYMALFAQDRNGGINTPEGARDYLRAVTLPSSGQIRLNGTHFFLASLLSLQGRCGEKGATGRPLYIGRRPFARTIFTTNFDPLLQVSLQLFQLLYYMTDRPEQLTADALSTDDHPAIHLFYAHGSVHRPFLANSDDEIKHLRERNAQSLASYLGRHGVIVLGYSGWDDCLLRALCQTSSFANNLYWLARSEASLSQEVRKFLLDRPNAYWVQIDDGGQWMAALHKRVCPGLPFTELLKNPIPFLRRRLEQVALDSIAPEPAVSRTSGSNPLALEASTDEQVTPESFRLQVIDLLKTAERQFEQRTGGGDADARLATLVHQADLAYGDKDWVVARDSYTQVIQERPLSPAIVALALFRRGVAHGQLGDSAKAIADYSAVIDLPSAPAEQVAMALVNRGVAHGQLGDSAKEIADCSAVIDLPSAPAKQVAMALVNRGAAHGQLGDWAKAIADYSAVIDLPGASAELVAGALVNRGVAHGQLGDWAKAIADYSAVIDLPGAPAELVAMALVNRGVAHGQLGDSAKAIADCSAVIDLPGAPAEQVAKALVNRGVAHGQLGDWTKAIADYSAVSDLPGAPAEEVAKALVNRGVTHRKLGDSAKEIADYSAIIDLPGAPAELVAIALFSRGVAHGQLGDSAKEIADYSAVIDLPGAPEEQVARANRARDAINGGGGT